MYNSNNFIYETIDVVVRPAKTVYIGNEGLGRTIVKYDYLGNPINPIVSDIFAETSIGYRYALTWDSLTGSGHTSLLKFRSFGIQANNDMIPLYVLPGEEFEPNKAPAATIPVCNPQGVYDAINLGFADYRYLKVVKSSSGLIHQTEIGDTETIGISEELVGSTVPKRRPDGTITVGSPNSPNDATNRGYVDNLVAQSLSSVYKAKGSKPASYFTLAQANIESVGNVYNCTETIIAMPDLQFVPGTQGIYPPGTNLVVVEQDGTRYWDILAGFVDLGKYVLTDDFNATINYLTQRLNDKQNAIKIIR